MKSNKAIATQLVKRLAKLLNSCRAETNRAKLLDHIKSIISTGLGLTLDHNAQALGGEGVGSGLGSGNGIESTLPSKNLECEVVGSGQTVTEAASAVSVAYTVDCGEWVGGGRAEGVDACGAKESGSDGDVEKDRVVGGGPVEAVVFRGCVNPRFVECVVGARRVSVFCGGRVYRRGQKVWIERDGGTEGAPRYRVVGQDKV